MALNPHFLILLPLLLSTYIPNSLSLRIISNGSADDYSKWVSWNVENHHYKRPNFEDHKKLRQSIEECGSERILYRNNKPIVLSLVQSKLGAGASGTSLDEKLRRAEMSKVVLNVSQDGTSNFTTISDALKTIPSNNTRRIIISIMSGIYREKIFIPRTMPFVTFSGDTNNPPTITGNDTASVLGRDGSRLGTYGSATVAVDASYFIAINIRFENSAPHKIGTVGEQAVAVRVSGNKVAFHNCSFYGAQDTLYDHKGLHYFHNCFIQGSVDFIFGSGRSFYENCHLNSIAKKVASLTAQKRSSPALESGFSFKECVVTGSGLVYLGRAWNDYSRVVYSYTYMGNIVLPQGWNDWGKLKRDRSVFYGEYKCSGPGSNMTGRVSWARILTEEEALPFLGTYYVDGDTWLIGP